LRARPFHQVAIVAADELHERVHRVARTCATDVAVVTEVGLPPAGARIITVGQAWSPTMDPRVVYVARDTISDDALADLITALSSGRALGTAAQLTKPSQANEARRAQQAFTGSRTFAAASNLVAAETSAVTTVRELLDADRAYLLFYDDADGSLKSAARGKDERRAIAGMAGWVARTGRAAATERATTDPRWLGPIDDPDGDPNSQLIIEPVIVGDRVRAVLVAARRPRRPGFVESDVQLLGRFAALLAPLLDQLLIHADTAPAPSPSVTRSKRATEQAVEDLREAQSFWQRLPMWSYAAAGGVVLTLIALVASC
jgi:GAF domain-containing protein